MCIRDSPRNNLWLLRPLVVVVAVVAVLLTLGLGRASAQGVTDDFNPDPDRNIWDAITEDPNAIHTEDFRTLVFDFHEMNGRIYVAGQFLRMRSPNGSTFNRPYLAALNVDTGAIDWNFWPNLDGPVYSVTRAPDGNLLIGGEFTGGIRVLNPATGCLLYTSPSPRDATLSRMPSSA